MKFAYADPPYPGQSRRHYGDHPDYDGEVSHDALIGRLCAEFDAWALSTSVKALPAVLPLCPADVLTLAWIKPVSPPMGDGRIYSWEPVLLHGGRAPSTPTRMHLVASPPQFTFRSRPDGHVIGEKPEAFSRWLFEAAGLMSDDEFHDLFPGSGAVGRAWEAWRSQQTFHFDREDA